MPIYHPVVEEGLRTALRELGVGALSQRASAPPERAAVSGVAQTALAVARRARHDALCGAHDPLCGQRRARRSPRSNSIRRRRGSVSRRAGGSPLDVRVRQGDRGGVPQRSANSSQPYRRGGSRPPSRRTTCPARLGASGAVPSKALYGSVMIGCPGRVRSSVPILRSLGKARLQLTLERESRYGPTPRCQRHRPPASRSAPPSRPPGWNGAGAQSPSPEDSPPASRTVSPGRHGCSGQSS